MLCVWGKKYAKNKSFALSSTKECANRSFDLVQFKLYFNKYFAFITWDKKALAFIPRKYLSCLCFDKCLIFFFSSGASTISGFFAAACSLPFDYVKTQIQKMQPDAEGKLPYSVSLDCALKTLRSGGPFKFCTGFPVYCVRIAPHVMVLSLSLFFSLCVCIYILVLSFYTQMFIFGSWHATEPFAENLLSLDCPLFLDLFHVFSDFGCLFFYADDMDFPQPDSKAGEKCWFIVSLQGWGFLYW